MKPKSLFRMFKAFLYPPKCLACGSLFQAVHRCRHDALNPERHAPSGNAATPNLFEKAVSGFLCPACNTGCTPVEPPFCTQCGTLFSSSGEDHMCDACIRTPPFFDSARAFGVYENSLMALVHSLKYKKDLQVARPLGQMLFNCLNRFFSDIEMDAAVPVPLHPIKFRARGFNQAYLLMRRWPDMMGSGDACLSGFKIKKSIIERKKNTRSQAGMDGNARLSNVKGAFYLKDPSEVSGKRILVVDDVMTTGATVNECAKTLKKGGAREVHVLTLARTCIG